MTPDIASLGGRRGARERALELIYEAEAKDTAIADLLAALPVEPTRYAVQLVSGVGEQQEEIDRLIDEASHRWRLARMPAVDRAILRLAAYELLARSDVPVGVVLAEAVELASQYSTDGSSRFVNGILTRLAGMLRPNEPLSTSQPVDE